MIKIIKSVVIYLIMIPLCLWGMVWYIGDNVLQPEVELQGLNITRATPREGYEIIFPLMYNGGPDRDNFYYLSIKKQVIYRYDEHRYLELQGEDCQGLIWYHDDEKNIHTRIDKFFFTRERLPTYLYSNPGHQYIGIPTENLSKVAFSLDEGRTFHFADVTGYAAVPGNDVERFISVDNPDMILNRDIMNSRMQWIDTPVTVSGSTGYFILKNGDILFGDNYLFINLKDNTFYFHSFNRLNQYIDDLKNNVDRKHRDPSQLGISNMYDNPIFQSRIMDIKKMAIKPYQGWDRIRCEIGAEK